MNVLLNGNAHSIETSCTVGELISMLELEGKFAVEINQNIIPRSEYASTQLNPDDMIEIVNAIGGG